MKFWFPNLSQAEFPVSGDFDNQRSLALAKEVDSAGSRTIGVFTKVDTLKDTSTKTRQSWLDIIEGRQHRLELGYHCIRQAYEVSDPSQEAYESEEDYFSHALPWSSSSHPLRFGTKHLIERVSTSLVKSINRRYSI